jgi:hypothetical protein
VPYLVNQPVSATVEKAGAAPSHGLKLSQAAVQGEEDDEEASGPHDWPGPPDQRSDRMLQLRLL